MIKTKFSVANRSGDSREFFIFCVKEHEMEDALLRAGGSGGGFPPADEIIGAATEILYGWNGQGSFYKSEGPRDANASEIRRFETVLRDGWCPVPYA